MKDQILKLLKEKPKHAIRMIVSDLELWSWIENHCDPRSNSNAIKVYTAISDEKVLCPCGSGKLRKLNSIKNGFFFCGRAKDCSACRNAVSTNCIKSAKLWDKEVAQEKRNNTNMKKYGMENVGQLPKAIETRKKLYDNKEWVQAIVTVIQNTCQEKYGVKNPLQVKSFLEKQMITMQSKYRVEHPIQNKEIKEKTRKTNQKKYGVDFPVSSHIVQDKIKNTCIKKYGVDYALESPEIRKKIEETIKEKYGEKYTSILQVPEMRDIILVTFREKYGVNSPSQINFPKEVVNILFDKEKFSELLRNTSVRQVCEKLNISRSLVKNYHDKYELDIIPKKSKSGYEDEIEKWLQENNIPAKKNDRKICKPLELDFYIPEYNLAIEFNGLYWHSEKSGGKGRNYHKTKFFKCQEQNIQLLTIFEDEWVEKSEIIKHHILHLCHKTEKTIGARKINIRPIDSGKCSVFLEKHHIQGSTSGSFLLGGFVDSKLVAVITLLKTKNGTFDINRYATDQEASYAGLFSKFLKYVERNFPFIKKVTTFADCRWSMGDVYIKSGFDKMYYLRPDYSYTDYNIRHHKFNYRKRKLKMFFENADSMTEKMMTDILELDRIWDCGKIKFEKTLRP
jgi:hypothetical protein